MKEFGARSNGVPKKNGGGYLSFSQYFMNKKLDNKLETKEINQIVNIDTF